MLAVSPGARCRLFVYVRVNISHECGAGRPGRGQPAEGPGRGPHEPQGHCPGPGLPAGTHPVSGPSKPQVVYSALLAIRYLAECRANREKLKGELGMMLSLQNVVQKSTTPGETKLLASEIYELLQASSGSDCEPAEEAVSSRRKAQFFLGSSNKRAKTVILHIDGLDDSSRRSLCEEALLKIRGVISFTFQMAVKRCIVGSDPDPVLRGRFCGVEQNMDLPDYLPEDESPSQEPDKAVSRVDPARMGPAGLAPLPTSYHDLSTGDPESPYKPSSVTSPPHVLSDPKPTSCQILELRETEPEHLSEQQPP
ncbi:hypothetical protein INR49_027199 [Caranx melampygus]|nr:hypothetical protein INR49_027199 [Caranx melampygus]